jgi:hypothetical protein
MVGSAETKNQGIVVDDRTRTKSLERAEPKARRGLRADERRGLGPQEWMLTTQGLIGGKWASEVDGARGVRPTYEGRLGE